MKNVILHLNNINIMLYLIGFMGAGKTTIGKQIAAYHNYNFIDTDRKIEEITGKNISDIFQEDGESYFRQLETSILKEISPRDIVSCGGGLPIYNNNMRFINDSGVSIYLKASEETIFDRLYKKPNNRILIRNKSKEELRIFIKSKLRERENIYLKADYIIETSNLSEEDILRKVNTLHLPF